MKLNSITFSFLILLLCKSAFGLSCAPYKDLSELGKWPHVFTGTIIKRDDKIARVRVVKSYKGNLAKEVDIGFVSELSNMYSSVKIFEVGKTYLITADVLNKENILDLGVCGIYKDIKVAKPYIKYLDSSDFQKNKGSKR